MIKLSML